MQGDLTLYSPNNPVLDTLADGDAFKYPIKSERRMGDYNNDKFYQNELFRYFGRVRNNQQGNSFNNDTVWYTSADIIQYELQVDWYFDKERSILDRFIIGIAPCVYEKDSKGNITGTKNLFWLNYPECSSVFKAYSFVDAAVTERGLVLDEIFSKRLFESVIVKESNLHNRDLNSYREAVDALLASERIKKKVRTIECDLWKY
jgi:gliding motility associated protien GldN